MAASPQAHQPGGFRQVTRSFGEWWRREVVGTVNQAGIIELRREEADISARFLFMAAVSAGIAILGLLLSSPAVVIGAMLIAPLMGPIIGLGFAMASGDYVWLRKCARSILAGTVLGVGLCALIVFLSPLQTVTAEIAARTRPNLFDLLVALFSGMAGAYALIRGRAGAVVGVAIATALMPPLAVVGFGIATLNWTVFSGALLLFVTNLVAIAMTAAVMARIYGFTTSLSAQHTRLQNVLILVVFVALAVPLYISLRQIVWESQASRQINSAVMVPFDQRSRLSQIEIDLLAQPAHVSATVLTPRLVPGAEVQVEQALRRQLQHDITLSLTQYQVGTGGGAAEEAVLAAARDREEVNEAATELKARLAVIAGVDTADVLVDREQRRALVRMRALDGASLGTYRALEQRLIQGTPGWRVELVPPMTSLPAISLADGEPDEAGRAAIDLIGWAASRRGTPVVLAGPQQPAASVRALLREMGVEEVDLRSGTAPLRAIWQGE